jgi:glycerol kinase
VVFVPALSGLACPYWDRSAAGLWLGISTDTSREDMCQAAVEGIALRTSEVIAAIQTRLPLAAKLSVDGGLTRSPYFHSFWRMHPGMKSEIAVSMNLQRSAVLDWRRWLWGPSCRRRPRAARRCRRGM